MFVGKSYTMLTWDDLLYFDRILSYFCIILFVQLTPKHSIAAYNILHHNPLLHEVHKNFYIAVTTFYLILAVVQSKCDITKDKLYTYCNN